MKNLWNRTTYCLLSDEISLTKKVQNNTSYRVYTTVRTKTDLVYIDCSELAFGLLDYFQFRQFRGEL